jgi:DNA-cytosine methyltransferase
MNKMNVVSLFNGMSFCKMALESLGVNVNKMYSSEIDKYANQATQAMFPDTIQLGDILNWREWDIDWASINLVTGGFPCQAWSMAGKQLGDKDERGMLFWTMLDIIKHAKHYNPDVQFLIENVKMKKEFEQYITTHTENALGKVYKVLINSALVSAQNRNRYYWTSFEVGQPEDRGIMLKDIIEHDGEYTYMSDKFVNRQEGRKCLRDDLDGKAVNLSAMEYVKNGRQGDYIKMDDIAIRGSVRPNAGTFFDGKTPTLCAGMGMGGGLVPLISDSDTVMKFKGKAIDIEDRKQYRKLTPRECFRLQTVPEHHIDTLLNAGISNTQLYKMCGNGWTMEVIKHIFKSLNNPLT